MRMLRHGAPVLLLVAASGLSAQQAEYSVFADRISRGCTYIMDSVPPEDQIPDYQTICACTGEDHLEYALLQEDSADELARLEWTALFYELADVEASPAYEDVDYEIIMACIEASGGG